MKAQRFVTLVLLVTLFTLAWGGDQAATAGIHAGPIPMTASEIDFTVPQSKPTTPTADPFTDIGAGLPGVYESAAAWGDYNNDGDLDILLMGCTGSCVADISDIYRNNSGVFTATNAGLAGADNGSVAWGDYDNDGNLDILLVGGGWLPSVSKVYRNNASTFTDIGAVLAQVSWGSAAWGDYDNDGDLDILFSNGKLYRNDGSGVFTNIEAGLSGGGAVAWGDYNNDGNLDILFSNGKLYRNNGNGTFTNVDAGLPGVSGGAAAWGDYNNDGNLDILLTGDTGSTCISRVYRNNGNGTFTDIGAGLTGVCDSSVAWGDYDNNGNLDILLAGYAGADTTLAIVYRNEGGGTFTDIGASLTGIMQGSVAWGDYDNDGKLDILLTGWNKPGYNNVAKVYRNNTVNANTIPSAPTGLAASVAGANVTLSWNAASDTQTPAAGLSYNLRVGTTPGGSQIAAPMAAGSGYRRVPQLGNANLGLTATLKNLAAGTYYWSVQAVDTAWAGSAFSDENSFTVALIPMTGASIDGRAEGVIQVGYSFVAMVSPVTATQPITFVWNASGQGLATHTNRGVTDTAIFTWNVPGPQVVTVTASSALSAVTGTHLITMNLPSTDTRLVVDTTVDSNDPVYQACTTTANDCSLRGAISKANADNSHAYSVLLPAGIYTLTLSGSEDNNATGDLDIRSSLTLIGGGTDYTIINGNQLDRVLHVYVGAAVQMSGVKITGGRTTNGGSGSYGGGTGGSGENGGGIYIASGTAVTLTNITVVNNTTGSGGAGGDGANCSDGNPANDGVGGTGGSGGGIYNGGMLTLDRSTLFGNATGRGGDGGASGPSIKGGRGGAGGPGSGIYNAGALALANSAVISNTTAKGGNGRDGGDGGSGGPGGIYNGGALTGNASIIQGNIAGDGGDGSTNNLGGTMIIGQGGQGGSGGGIYNSGALALGNSVIANSASGRRGNDILAGDWGGGSGSALYNTGPSLHLIHASVAHNIGGDGNGIYVTGGSNVAMTNTILVSHTTGIQINSGSTARLESTLWGSGAWANGSDWGGAGTIITGTHNYWGDPAFVDPASGDYHIGATSTAIDKGGDVDVDTDIDNQPRPNPGTGLPDLGADEYWVCAAINEMSIAGSVIGKANVPMTFMAVLTPSAPTPYILYTWWPEPAAGQGTAMVTYTFGTSGDYLVYLSAQNCGGSRETSHIISVETGQHYIYLPLVVKNP